MTGIVLIITHFEGTDLGWIHDLIRARGLLGQIARPFAGEPLPEVASVGAVISLGGPHSAYDTDGNPFLVEEQVFLRRAVEEDVPVLAICLGSQILAQALGGAAIRGSNGLECGVIDVHAAPGRQNLAPTGLEGRFFSFHTDTVIPPASAELLAISDRYPQAWRVGSALAVQFHPEISARGVRQLLSVEGPKLRAHGINVDALLAEAVTGEERAWAGAQRVVGGWLDTAVKAGIPQSFP